MKTWSIYEHCIRHSIIKILLHQGVTEMSPMFFVWKLYLTSIFINTLTSLFQLTDLQQKPVQDKTLVPDIVCLFTLFLYLPSILFIGSVVFFKKKQANISETNNIQTRKRYSKLWPAKVLYLVRQVLID